jgi:hypothetical protein
VPWSQRTVDIKTITDLFTAGATVVIALTGVLALIYARRQLKESREIEKVRHLVEFNKELDSEPMATWRRSVAEQRLEGVKCPDEVWRLVDFFETVALLVRRGYLDLDDAWNTFSHWMFYYNAVFRNEIEEFRKRDKNYYKDFCDLIEKFRKIEHANGGTSDNPNDDEITEFWEEEKNSVNGSTFAKRRSPGLKRKVQM